MFLTSVPFGPTLEHSALNNCNLSFAGLKSPEGQPMVVMVMVVVLVVLMAVVLVVVATMVGADGG